MVGSHLASSGFFFIVLLLSSSLGERTAEPVSYLDAFGKYQTLADKLNELIGAEEPLAATDIARLVSSVKHVCSVAPRHPKYQLTVSDLLKQYSKGELAVFDNSAVEQACAAIMACQLDSSCGLADDPSFFVLQDPGSVPVTNMLRVIAAVALFVEGLVGVYVPVLLKSVEGYEWWLSLLNCFSGGVFLAAGLIHLLPHCAEAQNKLAPLVGDYPLYLVLITLGYMLVLFVERVLFDVHGSAHGHGPHTGIAPPCVDCRTVEGRIMGSSDGGGSVPDRSNDDGTDAAAANGVDALTPGRPRYNLRSRGSAAAAGDDDPAAALAGLSTPLLAADAAAASPSPSKHRFGHDHAPHEHGHSAAAAADQGDDRGHRDLHHDHAVPLHHHTVVAGDMKQGVVLLVAMVVHTFLECMALGLMDMRKEFLMLFLAIASHKLISGLALSSRFLKDGATTKQITLYVGPFTLVAPSAILVGMFVRDVNPIVTLALSCFATGTFIYVGASEIVEEEFEGDMRSGRTDISQIFARWCKFGMLLLGVGAIAGLSLIPDAHSHAHNGHGHLHSHHHHH